MSREEEMQAALDRAQATLNLMRAEPSMENAEAFRDASTDVFARELEKNHDPHAFAGLAKEMSPQPTKRVLLRNVTGGGQFVNMPIDHPALKV